MNRLVARAAAAAALLAASPASAAEPITGRWVTQDGDGIVEVAPCGPALCGTIVRFLVAPPGGTDQRDVNNPDPRLRGRRLLGMPVLTGFVADANVWRGRIYDPKTGRSYRSVLRRRDARTLEVKGCIGPICQTQLWRQAR
ncbi:DUF2147 domain-containing protein [Erythrobacteraceae bacterium CFH 75059]|uniref:DUF2147 domain-containing protein n=1 Tax=Qipengyuania thermophila TaxID=2509361 RepID=UPI001021F0CC|nr:DUF2147 domain-containing protein [Qipengyuania thermophila]TCD06510.1 DUF2147 domain-containing protein [Erythrobacteraceae bacterium CFH 75059]